MKAGDGLGLAALLAAVGLLLGAAAAHACTPESYMSPGAVAKLGERGPDGSGGSSTPNPGMLTSGSEKSSTSASPPSATTPRAGRSAAVPGPEAAWVVGVSLLAGLMVGIAVYRRGSPNNRGLKAGEAFGLTPDELEAALQELIAEAHAEELPSHRSRLGAGDT